MSNLSQLDKVWPISENGVRAVQKTMRLITFLCLLNSMGNASVLALYVTREDNSWIFEISRLAS